MLDTAVRSNKIWIQKCSLDFTVVVVICGHSQIRFGGTMRAESRLLVAERGDKRVVTASVQDPPK